MHNAAGNSNAACIKYQPIDKLAPFRREEFARRRRIRLDPKYLSNVDRGFHGNQRETQTNREDSKSPTDLHVNRFLMISLFRISATRPTLRA